MEAGEEALLRARLAEAEARLGGLEQALHQLTTLWDDLDQQQDLGHPRSRPVLLHLRDSSSPYIALAVLAFVLAAAAALVIGKAHAKQRGRTQSTATAAPDVAFVGHATTVLSAFHLWMPGQDPTKAWRGQIWMVPFWPLVLVTHLVVHFVFPVIRGPYMRIDRFRYSGLVNELWLSRAPGFMYLLPWRFMQRRIAGNIEDMLRSADHQGIQVLGLGALNKAEFINRGGDDTLSAVRPKFTRLVHGNTLTAAVVVENIMRAIAACQRGHEQQEPTVFLTGATSKVGRAVALQLALRGVRVLCCTSSAPRFQALLSDLNTLLRQQHQHRHHGTAADGNTAPPLAAAAAASAAAAAAAGGMTDAAAAGMAHPPLLTRCAHVSDGVRCALWAVGKSDAAVAAHLPRGATAVVFAVPSPLPAGLRSDVTLVDGGTLLLDRARCGRRALGLLLPHDAVYACHAAAAVHAARHWTHHEVGPVDVHRMAPTLQAAFECGFQLPAAPAYFNAKLPAPGRSSDECNVGTVSGRQSQLQPAPLHGPPLASRLPMVAAAPRRPLPHNCRVVIVGAGPSGLATAAALAQMGESDVVLLDKWDQVGGGWLRQYPGLKITTRRAHCGLPYYAIPVRHKDQPKELSAGDYVDYLQAYALRFALDVRLGVAVASATTNVPTASRPGRHIITTACGQRITCEHLVVATGKSALPTVPDPLQRVLGLQFNQSTAQFTRVHEHGYTGTVVHSSRVRDLQALAAARHVCIVGCGNSASDLACEVVRLRHLLSQGHVLPWPVHMSIRSAPPVIMREWGLLGLEWVSRLAVQHMPAWLGDKLLDAFAAMRWGWDWRRQVFPPCVLSAAVTRWRARAAGRIPLVDKGSGSFVECVQTGKIQLHGPIVAASGAALQFTAEQQAADFDAVVLATGFTTEHHTWLGAQGPREGTARDMRAQRSAQVWLVGYDSGAALLPILQLSKDAVAVARAITSQAERQPARGKTSGCSVFGEA